MSDGLSLEPQCLAGIRDMPALEEVRAVLERFGRSGEGLLPDL